MQVNPRTILKETFGFDTFRPLQQEVIENVLNQKDTLVIMPTGGGKSLCYLIPALIIPGTTLVVSPLISLMQDQVQAAKAQGIAAEYLNSSLSYDAYIDVIHQLKREHIKVLFLAPETLLKPNILSLLGTLNINFVAIDEAHCISEWGHDFRPEYRQLADTKNHFTGATYLALTATATPRVQNDIINSLHFADKNKFVASFNRPNLFLEVKEKNNAFKQTLNFLNKRKGESGIIYCFSRKSVDSLTEKLLQEGFNVKPYHAGLDENKRAKNQALFIKDNVDIIVATIAFGMGINKPNVRFVIHYDLPKSVEGYYQEIGRAGRDGLPAHCLLLFSYGDIAKVKYFIEQKDDNEKKAAINQLNALLEVVENEQCRRKSLLPYFGETCDQDNCNCCDFCTTPPKEKSDVSLYAKKLFSCIARTRSLYGAAHIIDVLRGANTQKIQKTRHHELTTWGIGKELSRAQWQHFIRQCINQGLIIKDEAYGSLKLTSKGVDVMKGKTPFLGRLLPAAEKTTKPPTTHQEKIPTIKPAKTTLPAQPFSQPLFEALRRLRKTLADETNMPPYVICHDQTLQEMVTYLPQSTADLLTLHGIGQQKADKYGSHFLNAIKAFQAQLTTEEPA